MKKIQDAIKAFASIFRGSIGVFRERRYQGTALLGALVLFILYVYVPVWVVPGTTLAFELSLISPANYVLLGALALMSGILFSFELYSFRRSRRQGLRAFGAGSTGLLASIFGGVITAASCGCGVGILLGVIGIGGGTLFIATHQMAIVTIMLGIVMVGLYFSARRAAGLCATCSV